MEKSTVQSLIRAYPINSFTKNVCIDRKIDSKNHAQTEKMFQSRAYYITDPSMEDSRKKEQEHDELHRSIWSIADDLRGSVDGWDFKSYVLGTMFYRFLSEKLTTYLNNNEWNAGKRNFDYAKLSDEEAKDIRSDLIDEIGFFIPPSELLRPSL